MTAREAARRAVATAAENADELRSLLDMLALWPRQDASPELVTDVATLGRGMFDQHLAALATAGRVRGYQKR